MRITFIIISAIICALVPVASFAVAGDVIQFYKVETKPSLGIRGLAHDWSDGNVWISGVNAENDVKFAKINPATGSLVAPWRNFTNAYWAYDLGYGYMVGANRYFVSVDAVNPKLRVYNTSGSYVGSMPDPFTAAADWGVDCDWNGRDVFLTNMYYNQVQRWNGTSWATWAVTLDYAWGVATGWGRVFVLSDWPSYAIYEYTNIYGSIGSLVKSFTVRLPADIPKGFIGAAIGRMDVNPSREETILVGTYDPLYSILEVSVGNLTATNVEPSSLGRVKALYR